MDWRWSLEQATSELILKRGCCVDIEEVDSRQNEWQVQRPWGRISLWILEARGGQKVGNKEGCGEDRIREGGRGHNPWRMSLSDRRADWGGLERAQ